MKKVLIIYANPNKEGFGTSLGKSYIKGLKENKNEVKEVFLNDLDFDLKQQGYKSGQKFEKDLEKVQKEIFWADHITFCYPIWWYNFPAVLKGFFDRVFLPNVMYKYEGKPTPTGLLKGRTVRSIVTMDSPSVYFVHVGGAPDKIIMKNVMKFCGAKIIGHHYFGSVRKSTEKKKETWLNKAYSLGLKE